MQSRKCRIRLYPQYENLLSLETFIRACPLLSEESRHRAVLIATEYFDNIISHSKCLNFLPVSIVVSSNAVIRLRLSYSSVNFNEMVSGHMTASPHFDIPSGRYRGLGLRMCRNLSRHIEYKKGLFRHHIIIKL